MLTLLIFEPSVVAGLVFVLWAGWRWFAEPMDRRRSEYLLLIGVFGIIADPVAQAVADWMSQLRPMKMDLYVYAVDRYMGEPAFVLGRLVAPHAWAKVVLNVAYGLVPMAAVVVLAWQIVRRSEEAGRAVWAFVLNLALAPVCYLLLPVSGPKFAFPGFPADPGVVVAHMVPIDAAPNGIPSVHLSTALLVVWFSRGSRVGLALACGYLGLMAIATLASGQHYGVDLLAAVPYTAAVIGLSQRRWFRTGAAKSVECVTAER